MINMQQRLRQFLLTLIKHPFLKLLSVFFAFMLWSYVMQSTNPARNTTLSNMTVQLNGESQLNTRELALRKNPLIDLKNVSVELEVPYDDIGKVSKENVSVSISLSDINQTGPYEIKLAARTSYGRVRSISPASVSVKVERRVSISVPTEAALIGEMPEGYWHGDIKTTPEYLQVFGPESVIELVKTARAELDISTLTEDFRAPVKYALLNADGAKIDTSALRIDNAAFTVTMPVLPMRTFALRAEDFMEGKVESGYRIKNISVMPETLDIAAPQSVLDSLFSDSLPGAMFDAVDIDGLAESHSYLVKLHLPDEVIFASARELYVTVEVEQDITTKTLQLPIEYRGLDETLRLTLAPPHVSVTIAGPRLALDALDPATIHIDADLTGLPAGDHTVSLFIRNPENFKGLTLTLLSTTANAHLY